jgi:CHASE1-domain containing sensor protein
MMETLVVLGIITLLILVAIGAATIFGVLRNRDLVNRHIDTHADKINKRLDEDQRALNKQLAALIEQIESLPGAMTRYGDERASDALVAALRASGTGNNQPSDQAGNSRSRLRAVEPTS